jgi:SAM-dependent methyltransferase
VTPPDTFDTDPLYLRDAQYAGPSNLHARASLMATYGRADEPWYPWLASRVVWPAGGDVLDVGCGYGALWTNIAALVSPISLTVTDLSEGMVHAAADAVEALPAIKLAEARVCDAQALPFADASFDVAVANHMLYHVPDRGRAVAELARVLRPDGVLLAATNGPGHLGAVSELQVEVYGSSPREFIGRRFGKLSGGEILRAAFAEVEWHDHPGVLECDDPEAVVAFVASTSIAQEAPPEKLDELRRAVVARFDAEGGVLRTRIESGCFVASEPLSPRGPGPAPR